MWTRLRRCCVVVRPATAVSPSVSGFALTEGETLAADRLRENTALARQADSGRLTKSGQSASDPMRGAWWLALRGPSGIPRATGLRDGYLVDVFGEPVVGHGEVALVGDLGAPRVLHAPAAGGAVVGHVNAGESMAWFMAESPKRTRASLSKSKSTSYTRPYSNRSVAQARSHGP